MSTQSIHEVLQADHERLSALLTAACSETEIDLQAYHSFRGGLVRHISIEEKILLPALRRWRNGEDVAIARQLKLDHSALATLLVPTPTAEIIERVRGVLESHNATEEGVDGFYATCDASAGDRADEMVARLMSAPSVALAPYHDTPRVFEAIERAVRAAGRR